MKRQKFLRKILFFYVVFTLFIAVIGLTPLPNLLAKQLSVSSHLIPSQCIVILGGGVLPEGNLSTASLERTVSGAILYRKGLAPTIIVSTGISQKRPPFFSEAQMMQKTLVDLGIPENAILLEEKSTRTAENAFEVIQLMGKMNYQNALLVTSTTHIQRSLLSFQKYGMDIRPAPVPFALENDRSFSGRIRLFQVVCHEYVGMFYYRLRGWI